MSLTSKSLASLVIKSKLAKAGLTKETIEKDRKFEQICAQLQNQFDQIRSLYTEIISTLNAYRYDLDNEDGFFVFDQIEENSNVLEEASLVVK